MLRTKSRDPSWTGHWEVLAGQPQSQPLMGTRSHVRASLLCHTLNIVLFPQGGSIPSSQKSQPVAAWVAIVLKFKGTIGL